MDDIYIGRFLDDRYEILEKIGTGGMAVVYKARCHRLNRFVAIKILKNELAQDADLRRRFHAESQAVAMLSHPNIVAVYDVSHSDNIDYIVMELIEGITLKQYINRKGILNWKEVLHFTTQITKALDHAHSRGIIHRDIKPQNIMILKDGSVKVADFGIARLLSTQNTLTQEALGSVHYISPEQAKGGAVDARSDIYSVGVVMYEMLTGRLPFEGDSPVSIAIQHISSIPLMPRDINPDIPVGLADITMRAMNSDIDMRYESASALLADLEEFRKNPSVIFHYSALSTLGNGDFEETRVLPNDTAMVASAAAIAKKKNKGNALSRDNTTADEYRKNRRRAGKTSTLIGIFCIVAFLIAVAWFLWNYTLKDWLAPEDDRIIIPNFVGMELEKVQSNDEYSIYNFDVIEMESAEHEAGRIMSQDPVADRSVVASESGIDITLTVSTGVEQIFMPDIMNMEYRSAVILLQSYKLDLNIETIPVPHENVTSGYIVEQLPLEGEELFEEMSVYITYSTGPVVDLVPVPDVLGITKEQAIQRIQSYNLSYEFIDPDYSDEYEEGRVMFQSTPAGEEVPVHSSVKIQLSLGPEPVVDPPVVDPPVVDPPVVDPPVVDPPVVDPNDNPDDGSGGGGGTTVPDTGENGGETAE